AGHLTEEGARLLGGAFPEGIPFAPPEGDAGTGMTATNAVLPRTGNVSAGTSIFSMIVLEKPLKGRYTEIDIVATPDGSPVAMVHCNNCTGDMNLWAELLGECAALFGAAPDRSELFTRLYEKSLEGEADCGGVTVCNYLAGEGVTGFDRGIPLVMRAPGASFGLANFMRAQLYSSLATLSIGMDILASEKVKIDSISGHGGLFKTPLVGQRYLAAACRAPISLWETAGEGGPYGMALLAAFMHLRKEGEALGDFLKNRAFRGAKCNTLSPLEEDERGFSAYLEGFRRGLEVERAAVENM
ncbi:MAG: ATPase, partial [Oscillospiraceae bacterium]|nr:ATPase [Oscillospiraceae bacterium]